MKRLFLLVSIVILSASLTYGAAIQPIGKSLLKTGTAGIWVDNYDMLQRAEDYGKLKSMIILGLDPTYWGSTGFNFGVAYDKFSFAKLVLFGKYVPSINKSGKENLYEGINDFAFNTITTNGNPLSYTDNSDIIIGCGSGIGFIGIMYALDIENNYTESAIIYNNVYVSNSSISYKNSETDFTSIINNGKITHIIELGATLGKTGKLKPQLQIKYGTANSDNTKNYSKNHTTIYDGTTSQVLVRESESTYSGPNITDSVSLLNNYDSIKYINIGIAPEIKYSFNKKFTAYIGGEINFRSIDKDSYYEFSTNSTVYYTSGANKSKITNYNSTIDSYRINQKEFNDFDIYLKAKYKINLTEKVSAGIYPTYSLSYLKFIYGVNKTSVSVTQSDSNGDGVISSSETTTITTTGDNDSVEYTSIKHKISLPIAIKWAISKVVTLRLGSKWEFTLDNKVTKLIDINNGTTSTTVIGSTSTINTIPAQSTSVSAEATSFSMTTKQIYFSAGINVTDNLKVDLLSTITTVLDLASNYAIQASYIF